MSNPPQPEPSKIVNIQTGEIITPALITKYDRMGEGNPIFRFYMQDELKKDGQPRRRRGRMFDNACIDERGFAYGYHATFDRGREMNADHIRQEIAHLKAKLEEAGKRLISLYVKHDEAT